ncbi:NTP transferase domain-containing protein [Fulvivirgaceae bacterium BMA10]|uniref:NTP transferase domain-containing protein n=1 Tax=Splendidivirga corallicola TaxID=3051826 RepID=A0ABT8KXM8_9BACT|nr:NTP transferase domain-containing protein [Fulvivirgaceae bacterium BMA10]
MDKKANASTELLGLVLIGGKSSRMQTDKSALVYYQRNQLEHTFNLLQEHCSKVHVACNTQQFTSIEKWFNPIRDEYEECGPINALLTGFERFPGKALLVVAIDMPLLSGKTLKQLIKHRNSTKSITTFKSPSKRTMEPLLAIWEPRSYPTLKKAHNQGHFSLNKSMLLLDVECLHPDHPEELQNVNTPEEYQKVISALKRNF